MNTASLRRIGTWLIALIGLTMASAVAQRDRITGAIDSYRTVPVRGHLNPMARAEFDRGAADPNIALRGMTLAVRRTAAQQKDLDQLRLRVAPREPPRTAPQHRPP